MFCLVSKKTQSEKIYKTGKYLYLSKRRGLISLFYKLLLEKLRNKRLILSRNIGKKKIKKKRKLKPRIWKLAEINVHN